MPVFTKLTKQALRQQLCLSTLCINQFEQSQKTQIEILAPFQHEPGIQSSQHNVRSILQALSYNLTLSNTLLTTLENTDSALKKLKTSKPPPHTTPEKQP